MNKKKEKNRGIKDRLKLSGFLPEGGALTSPGRAIDGHGSARLIRPWHKHTGPFFP